LNNIISKNEDSTAVRRQGPMITPDLLMTWILTRYR